MKNKKIKHTKIERGTGFPFNCIINGAFKAHIDSNGYVTKPNGDFVHISKL